MAHQRHPVVHLELHTGDMASACAYYADLCGWETERVHTNDGSYNSLDPGGRISGGVVECATQRPLWLPYIEVDEITRATARATELGASVLLSPREGPAGWRSVISGPAGGEVAFWQPKR